MLSTEEKRFGLTEIGEGDPRACPCGGLLFILDSWPLHRGEDYFTYRRCPKCGRLFKVLEPVPPNLWFIGKIPTNQHGREVIV